MKLSPSQQRALDKLTDKFQSAYSLGESISTLDSLVKKGLAESRSNTLGAMYSPRTSNLYKKS